MYAREVGGHLGYIMHLGLIGLAAMLDAPIIIVACISHMKMCQSSKGQGQGQP